jgi:hypothetical protein
MPVTDLRWSASQARVMQQDCRAWKVVDVPQALRHELRFRWALAQLGA